MRSRTPGPGLVPFRRSMLHGEPFPAQPPKDWEAKALCHWVPMTQVQTIERELDWLAPWGSMLWNVTLLDRMLKNREWSR